MLVAPQRLIEALRKELAPLLSDTTREASTGQGINAALKLLEVRERGGLPFARSRLDNLAALLADLPIPPATLADLASEIDAARALTGLDAVEAAWRALLMRLESILDTLRTHASVPPAVRARATLRIAAWEIADRLSLLTPPPTPTDAIDTSVTQPRLEHYLRHRFAEPTLRVAAFHPLPGGFGKQTILFEVEGHALSGRLVMRRDPSEPTVDNDCHRVRIEYHVVVAAFQRGFAAPDALWLDTDHALLPGGDFMIMRCSPGETGGNVFRATTTLSEDLVQVLATAMARLHTLPPSRDLGALTNSIRPELWDMSLHDCTRQYIQGWHDSYVASAHNSSPTLIGLYGWLFDNVPNPAGPAALLHGDVGFHNMLIHEGQLSALVDWEFAHVGDPAEDIGYIRNTTGGLPWDNFMDFYQAAGGPEIDPVRLHFFQVWGQVRNAGASNITMGKFEIGVADDLKLAYTGHYHFPHFIKAACDLIEAGPYGKTKDVDY